MTQNRATALVYDDRYLEHDTGPRHPERPERLRAVMERLSAAPFAGSLLRVEAEEAGLEHVHAVHRPEYVEHVRELCRSGARFADDPDVPICPQSFGVALAAAGGAICAVDAVMSGRARNAFCALRPPGHHALPDEAMGFCIFNNAAIAARHLQRRHGLRRILIVDWDVHHGNGTQEAFYEDADVFYFSTHQFPWYPGSGTAGQSGLGPGRGATLNVPLSMGAADKDAAEAFRFRLLPAARAFQPEFVLVSAGFDAHVSDPLGGLAFSSQGYAELTRITRRIADELCSGRLVSVLEGGYNLSALADSVEAHVRVLTG